MRIGVRCDRIRPTMALSVLHVTGALDFQAGSPAICLRGLFPALAGRGCVSSLMLDASPRRTPDGVERAASQPGELRALVQRADVIHIHGWGGRWAEVAASEAKKRGKPYIVVPLGALSPDPDGQESWLGRLRFRFSEAGLIRGAARVQALGEIEQADIEAAVPGAPVACLPYGLDFSAYEGAGRDDVLPTPPGRSLLALGPIHPAEGLVMLLKSFAQVGADADGWTVVIAGEEIDDWRTQLEAVMRRKGGAERVIFAGAGDEHTQRGWLNRASLLAAPALRMRCPSSVLQALACRVSVLATAYGAAGVPDDVVDSCPPDADAFTDALREALVRAEPDRVESAERAWRTGRDALDWTALAPRYQELYEQVRADR